VVETVLETCDLVFHVVAVVFETWARTFHVVEMVCGVTGVRAAAPRPRRRRVWRRMKDGRGPRRG
jgi:hypothetical protein